MDRSSFNEDYLSLVSAIPEEQEQLWGDFDLH